MEFTLTWNRVGFRYSLDIIRSDNTRIDKVWPLSGEFRDYQNWNRNSSARPDAKYGIVDTTGQERTPLPSNIGTGFAIVVLTGVLS